MYGASVSGIKGISRESRAVSRLTDRELNTSYLITKFFRFIYEKLFLTYRFIIEGLFTCFSVLKIPFT